MNCSKCGNNNQDGAKFCKSCGIPLNSKGDLGSVDLYFHTKNNTCKVCGEVAVELRQIKLYQNIGMLIQRQYASIEGKLCKKCIDDYFWKYTLITLILGWWGTISFFITPFYLINNVFRYLFTLNMKAK